MINNFPEQTKPLTEYELKMLLPVIVSGLKTKKGIDNAITNSKMCDSLKRLGYKITAPRMRAIIHHIRVNDIIPLLIGTSKGYYISDNEIELFGYVESLDQRINSISFVRNALRRQFNNKQNNQTILDL